MRSLESHNSPGIQLSEKMPLGPGTTRFWTILLAALFLMPAAVSTAAQDVGALIAPTRDRALIQSAIDRERPDFTPPPGVTGITVPHHLLAAEVMARGFWAASGAGYDRVILIGPDHFHAAPGRFATTLGNFDTVFGSLQNDVAATRELLKRSDLFQSLPGSASHEHGWHALTPFIRYFWPDAKIVPILAAVNTRKGDWKAAADAILPIIGPNTLVVQSTDYSHYLTLPMAVQRDQESMAVIGSREPNRVEKLLQPAHVDSKASQYIQMALQEAIGAHPVIVANRNSADFSLDTASTTSYVVSIFVRDPAVGAIFRYADQDVVYFGGDVLLGRYLTPLVHDHAAVDAIVAASEAIIGDAPLVVNLEGVILDEVPSGLPQGAHLMVSELAVPVLRRLGVVAVNLANNHSEDLGALGFSESLRILTANGIIAMRHGDVTDLGSVRVLPIGFLPDAVGSNPYVSGPEQLDFVCRAEAAHPLIAFTHWGEEYVNTPGPRELEAAHRLAACGVPLIIGTHSHLASLRVQPLAGGAGQLIYSLGNYLFDQSARRSSGALLEVRVFSQGTLAARLIPIPNLFDFGNRIRAGGAR